MKKFLEAPVRPKITDCISAFAEAEEMHEKIAEGAARTAKSLAKLLAAQPNDPMSLLRALRFDTVGHDPLTGEPLNFVEQLNQTFTILVTLRAIEQLFKLHPDAGGFRLALGNKNGRDIESVKEGLVAAEAFSATHPMSNQKLKKDLMRLETDPAQFRYVFFCCPGYYAGRQPALEKNGVQVYAVDL
jgi:hypothetical protein